MRLRKALGFFYQVITGGLAAAFVVLMLSPELMQRAPVAEVVAKHAATSAAAVSQRVTAPLGPVSYAEAVARAGPAGVNINTTKVITGQRQPFLDDRAHERPFGAPPDSGRARRETGLGSGVIVSHEGYVLTNHHVIAGAEEIRVLLQDGRESSASVVGTDRDTDLAVLKINLATAPAITMRTTDDLRVGDVVLAIGNPFGFNQTVTMGIVSATGRSHLGINTFEDFIQTDAAINPGNSGGALINPQGQLVGINTAIFSRSGAHGIGFAIPTSLAKRVMQEIIERGYVARGWLGIEVHELTPGLAESLALKSTSGVLVSRVIHRSPAQLAGLQPGDVVTHVDRQPVVDRYQAVNVIAQVLPGRAIALRILRDGRVQTVEATVAQRPVERIP